MICVSSSRAVHLLCALAGHVVTLGGSVVRKLLLLLAVTALVAGTGASARAASPGPGSSTGAGSVFVPNPVQSLGNESLTDQKDADAAVPAAAYRTVTLTNLDRSGHLSGDY